MPYGAFVISVQKVVSQEKMTAHLHSYVVNTQQQVDAAAKSCLATDYNMTSHSSQLKQVSGSVAVSCVYLTVSDISQRLSIALQIIAYENMFYIVYFLPVFWVSCSL